MKILVQVRQRGNCGYGLPDACVEVLASRLLRVDPRITHAGNVPVGSGSADAFLSDPAFVFR